MNRAQLPAERQEAPDIWTLMERLDEEAILAELEEIAVETLCYHITDPATGKQVFALSKGGVDEACNQMEKHGHVIRDVDLKWELHDEFALFVATAARFIVNVDYRPESSFSRATEVPFGRAVGTKKQDFFDEGRQLTLDSRCPTKRARNRTFRQMLAEERQYLEWMRDNFREEEVVEFLKQALEGAKEPIVNVPPRPNRFWFEQGSQKAIRNARERLISAEIKARVIALAKASGKVREAEASIDGDESGAPDADERKASRQQINKIWAVMGELRKLSALSDAREAKIKKAIKVGLTADEASQTIDALEAQKARAEKKVKDEVDASTPAGKQTVSELQDLGRNILKNAKTKGLALPDDLAGELEQLARDPRADRDRLEELVAKLEEVTLELESQEKLAL